MKNLKFKYFIALSIISIVLVQCKENNPNKDKKVSVSKSEQDGFEKSAMREPVNLCENGHTISLWIPRDNGGCDAVSYCEIYDSETHSVSGNLFMENDTFKNSRMANQIAPCIGAKSNARFSVLAYYEIAVPNEYVNGMASTNIITKLFADNSPVSANIEVFSLTLNENDQNGSLDITKELTTSSNEEHYQFCQVDEEGAITGNTSANYLVSIEYQSSNLASRKENFELLFAIVEPHNTSIAHDHHATTTNQNFANTRQTSEVITESEIADLSTSSLDQLRNLNNSTDHIAEHIELIPFTVCYPGIGDGEEIDINEANHGRGH